MGFKSNMSGIVAKQLGSLQGKLIAQIEGNVSNILKKFSNECPSPSDLEKIIKIKNNLIRTLNSFQRRVDSFKGTANKLQTAVSSATAIIKVIKSIPIPTAIIPPMTGGVGLPISILTKYSDALVTLNKIVETLESDISGVNAVIGSVSMTITSLRSRLELIDSAIERCSKGSQQIVAAAQPPENTGSEGTPSPDYLYKGYVLAIIQDPNSPKIAPKRYAIATDNAGIVRLRGESSFSSDTQVLLDEIKFKIDNQLA